LFLFALDNSDFTMGSITAANAEFCFDVFKELKVHHANDNIFYSPLSIISALAMVYLGARGNTQSQMEKVKECNAMYLLIFISSPQCGTSEYIHNSFKDLLSDITVPNATYSLKIADRLYIEKTYPVLPEYLKCAKKFYEAGLEEVNFKTDTEEARQLINSWVEKETSEIFPHIQPKPPLAQLEAISSRPIARYLGEGTDTHLPTTSFQGVVESDEVSPQPPFLQAKQPQFPQPLLIRLVLQTPHQPQALRPLHFCLRHCIPCLSLQLENKISFEKLMEWSSPNVMEKRRVKVYLPRMKIEEKYNLTSVLMALGMTDLFSPSANLSGISSAESLKISEAIHEAYMEVNEEGTEMAGSASMIGDIKHSSEFEEFRADHPFLFLIKHNPTNSILFFGRYCSP
ncbi:Ovalbumin-related protein Y, partial [Eudyptes chrysolophus]